MKTIDNYFNWHDCWVITGILWATPDEAEIDLSAIIAAGDMLNHSIYTEKELKEGFYKAQKKGLISIQANKIKVTEEGCEIRNKVQSMRGGLFSIVDNMYKELNSIRTKLIDMSEETIDTSRFITHISVKESYEQYRRNIEKDRSPSSS